MKDLLNQIEYTDVQLNRNLNYSVLGYLCVDLTVASGKVIQGQCFGGAYVKKFPKAINLEVAKRAIKREMRKLLTKVLTERRGIKGFRGHFQVKDIKLMEVKTQV